MISIYPGICLVHLKSGVVFFGPGAKASVFTLGMVLL